MLTLLYGFVTGSSCTDVHDSFDRRGSCSKNDAGWDDISRGEWDVPTELQDAAESGLHAAAGWLQPRKDHAWTMGEVVGDR